MENDAAKHDEKSTGKSLHLHGLAWHTLPPDEVAALWKTSKQSGLTAQEAAQRLSDFGENCLPEPVRRAAWLRFLLQFHNPLIYVLLLAGSVTLALGGLVDALVILGVVVINAVIGFGLRFHVLTVRNQHNDGK